MSSHIPLLLSISNDHCFSISIQRKCSCFWNVCAVELGDWVQNDVVTIILWRNFGGPTSLRGASQSKKLLLCICTCPSIQQPSLSTACIRSKQLYFPHLTLLSASSILLPNLYLTYSSHEFPPSQNDGIQGGHPSSSSSSVITLTTVFCFRTK